MDWREVLQKELWSKETSRKWLVFSSKVLVVLLVVVAGLTACYWIESHWLTHSERNAADFALTQIDLLQDFQKMSVQEFAKQDGEARSAVQKAFQAEWTLRDRSSASLLSFYLYFTETDRTVEVKLAEHNTDLAKRGSSIKVFDVGQMQKKDAENRELLRSEIKAFMQ